MAYSSKDKKTRGHVRCLRIFVSQEMTNFYSQSNNLENNRNKFTVPSHTVRKMLKEVKKISIRNNKKYLFPTTANHNHVNNCKKLLGLCIWPDKDKLYRKSPHAC